jgi:hypothetical protein
MNSVTFQSRKIENIELTTVQYKKSYLLKGMMRKPQRFVYLLSLHTFIPKIRLNQLSLYFSKLFS